MITKLLRNLFLYDAILNDFMPAHWHRPIPTVKSFKGVVVNSF